MADTTPQDIPPRSEMPETLQSSTTGNSASPSLQTENEAQSATIANLSSQVDITAHDSRPPIRGRRRIPGIFRQLLEDSQIKLAISVAGEDSKPVNLTSPRTLDELDPERIRRIEQNTSGRHIQLFPDAKAFDTVPDEVVRYILTTSRVVMVITMALSFWQALVSFPYSKGSFAFHLATLELWYLLSTRLRIDDPLKTGEVLFWAIRTSFLVLLAESVWYFWMPTWFNAIYTLTGRSEPDPLIVPISTFIPSITLPVIYLLHNFYSIYARTTAAHRKQAISERHNAQERLNEAVEDYMQRRATFIHTLQQEFSDGTLMASATLEQFSPRSLLTRTQELLSTCSIPVPIASVSAIHTTMKHIQHLASHLELISQMQFRPDLDENEAQIDVDEQDQINSEAATPQSATLSTLDEFDIDELLQNVGDALAGVAAKQYVELVVFHTEFVPRSLNVLGDRGGIRYALVNLLRMILDAAAPGACVELGLHVVPFHNLDSQNLASNDQHDPDRLLVTFELIHSPPTADTSNYPPSQSILFPNAELTSRLLEYLRAVISSDEPEEGRSKIGITFDMKAVTASKDNAELEDEEHQERRRRLSKQHSTIKFADEPTPSELIRFVKALKGMSVTLYAHDGSAFAKHLTNDLTSWGTDISHVPLVNSREDGDVAPDFEDKNINGEGIEAMLGKEKERKEKKDKKERRDKKDKKEEQNLSISPAVILIDDDVATLDRVLLRLRTEPPKADALRKPQQHRRIKSITNLTAASSSSPSLSSNQSSLPSPSASSPSTTTANAINHSPLVSYVHTAKPLAIIYFTSLANYKRVKDSIHWLLAMPIPGAFALPQVLVVPKPAGPRRFLTALHTAIHRSVVEPHYMPIATSPSTPMGMQISLPTSPSTGPHHTQHANTILPVMSEDYENVRRGGSSPHGSSSPSNSSLSSIPATPNSPSSQNNYFSPMVGSHGSTSTIQVITGSPTGVITQQGILFTPNPSNQTGNRQSTSGINSPPLGRTLSSGTVPTMSRSQSAMLRRKSLSHDGTTKSNIGEKFMNLPPQTNGFQHPPLLSPGGSPLRIMMNAEPDTIVTSPSSVVGPQPPSPSGSTHSMIDGILPISPGLKKSKTATNPSSVAAAATAVRAATPKTPPPRKIDRKKSDKDATSTRTVNPPINVLIVEDNRINQLILSGWMQRQKLKFAVAENGRQAVDKWKEGGFHLILMDIQLPVMSGIEATREIRRLEKESKIGVFPSTPFSDQLKFLPEQPDSPSSPVTPVSSIPPSPFRSPVIIVALTASSLQSDRHEALAAGCNDFLTKPVSLPWLEKKITEWGCMQALIDFEGWRKWKRQEDSKNNNNSTGTLLMSTTSPGNSASNAAGLVSFARGVKAGSKRGLESSAGDPISTSNKQGETAVVAKVVKNDLPPSTVGEAQAANMSDKTKNIEPS